MKSLRILSSIVGTILLLSVEIHIPDNPTFLDVFGSLGMLGIFACMVILPWVIKEKE